MHNKVIVLAQYQKALEHLQGSSDSGHLYCVNLSETLQAVSKQLMSFMTVITL